MDAYGDPHCVGRAGVDCDRPHRYASRHELAGLVQEAFTRDPHVGDLYVFRGKSGKLIKILWHDGLGISAIYSLIATAQLNDVDPQAWLADVLARLPDHSAKRIDELLPWNWQPQSVAHAA